MNARALRDRLSAGPMVVAPGVFDGFSALLAERSGAQAAYLSGYAVAASRYGLPDAGLVGLREMLDAIAVVRGACHAPLVADADTGYGGLLNVQHTVRAYEALGVAAIQLEDQELPKKCGHTQGKRLVPVEEVCAKVAVAAEAREEMLVIARTDARALEGLDAALGRARAYRRAGADVLFVEAPESEAELVRVAAELEGPVLVNVVPAGMRTPPLPVARLEELGFALAIYPGVLALAAVGAMHEALQALLATGEQLAPTIPLDPHELVGFPAVWADEARWQARFGQAAGAQVLA